MSLSSILGIARSALIAHQRAMQVTAHNVANAQTPGYTRQRLDLAQAGPGGGGIGLSNVGWFFGQGVTTAAISRIRDPFLDGSYRDEAANLGMASTLRQYLQSIEGKVGEPSDHGISSALDGMFTSFSALANDPSNSIAREQVRDAADRLARLFRQLDGQLETATQQATDQLDLEIAEVNRITGELADLNGKILALSAGAGSSPDLLDQRDLLLDQLSGFLSVQVQQAEDGTLTVSGGGAVLVSGVGHERLSVEGAGVGLHVALEGGRGAIDPESGSLAGLVDLVSNRIPALRAQLDDLAAQLVNEVNTIHRSGTTLTGDTGVDFFDPAGVTAGTIHLSDAIEGSLDAIAASETGGPGDNGVALRLASLGQASIAGLGGRTFSSFYAGFSGSLGVQTRSAQQDEEASLTLFGQAEAMRSSVAGVSVDEEMVNLITQQEAYQAAARLVTVADEMMDILMQSV